MRMTPTIDMSMLIVLTSASKPVDGIVHTYQDHEDSVYSAAWSLSDPWTFASLSFDGRIVVNSIPLDHKYKILL